MTAPEATGAFPPLLESKLVPPRSRPGLVVRQRILDQLDGFASCPLTLVDAPVGSGKTVALQSWVARTDVPVAWVSLDSGDDDPARLWTYVATAVDRIRPGIGRGALSRLAATGVPTSVAVDELLNGIASYGETLAIVLDDLHTVASDECADSIAHAVEHLPANARIVVATRSDPRLPLARLRANGQLGELRARDLAFTVDEARPLVGSRDVLPDQSMQLLVARTEGWAAGLYLATLWLRTLDDPAAGIDDFHGDHRHVADYLSGEVLDTLDETTREFLVRTSILERFTPELCDAVLERTGSAELLAELAGSNLFLVPLDNRGEWFRYHHLFGELLRLELTDPALVETLRLRAFEWCRERGLLDEAFEHVGAAGDWDALATILAEHHRLLVTAGRQATLLRWLERLPDEVIVDHAVLAVAGELAARLARRPTSERLRFHHLAERARRDRPNEWTPYHEVVWQIAGVGWIEDNLPAARLRALQVVTLARDSVGVLLVPSLACAAIATFLSGEPTGARALVTEGLQLPGADTQPHGWVYLLGIASLLGGEGPAWDDPEGQARRALAEAHRLGIATTASGGLAHTALAIALAAGGRLREAEREAIQGQRLRRQSVPEIVHAYSLLVLADVRLRRGRLSAAGEALALARTILDSFTDAGIAKVELDRLEDALAAALATSHAPVDRPSAAELSVLQLLASELSQREIGAHLFLSLNTVKTHTRVLYRKLGVTSREAAVARATALGLLEDGESPG